MVILLLGIMATFTSQFIGIGSQIYGDASSREQLMSDARFAMERLNREVRDAVPGSERIETTDGVWVDSGACLQFWPISTSSRYITLNRAISGSSATLELVMATPASAANPLNLDANAVTEGDLMIVFPCRTKSRFADRWLRLRTLCGPGCGCAGSRIRGANHPLCQCQQSGWLIPGSRVYFCPRAGALLCPRWGLVPRHQCAKWR